MSAEKTTPNPYSNDATAQQEASEQARTHRQQIIEEATEIFKALKAGARYKEENIKNGEGGEARVLQHRDHWLGRTVVFKYLKQDYHNPEAAATLLREAQRTAQLQHPNVVQVYDLGYDKNKGPWFAMQRAEGQTLRQGLASLRTPEAANRKYSALPTNLPKLLATFQKVCAAVSHAHEGAAQKCVHCDLKPENIMIGAHDEVLVLDWGTAKNIDGERDTSQRHGFTPGYAAPEQYHTEQKKKDVPIDTRTDIYALGAILFEIITLERAIQLTSAQQNEVKKCKSETATFEEECETTNKSIARKTLTDDQKRRLQELHEKEIRLIEKYLLENATSEFFQKNLQTLALAKVVNHCRDGRVPRSLLAVALKAMACEKDFRYQSVKELQAEIAAFQNRHPTKAERSNFWTRLRYRIRRSPALCTALFVLVPAVLALSGIVLKQKRQNERATDENIALHQSMSQSDLMAAQTAIEANKWQNGIAYLERSIRFDSKNTAAQDAFWLTLAYGERDLGKMPAGSPVFHSNESIHKVAFSENASDLIVDSLKTESSKITLGGYRPAPVPKEFARLKSASEASPHPFQSGSIAATSPDETRNALISKGDQTVLEIWDVQSQKMAGPPMVHTGSIHAVVFSPDGTRLATISRTSPLSTGPHKAQMWEVPSGKKLGSALETGGSLNCLSFSFDTRFLASGDAAGDALLWSTVTHEPRGKVQPQNASASEAKAYPGGVPPFGRKLKSFPLKDGKVLLGDPRNLFLTSLGPPLLHGSQCNASFLADGKHFETVCPDFRRIWRLKPSHQGQIPFKDLAATMGGKLFEDSPLAPAKAFSIPERKIRLETLLNSLPVDSDWYILCQRLQNPLPSLPWYAGDQETIQSVCLRLIKDLGDETAVREAQSIDPGNPLLPLAFAALEDNKKADPQTKKRATYLRKYAVARVLQEKDFLDDARKMLLKDKETDTLKALTENRIPQ